MTLLFLASVASLGLWIILHNRPYARIFNSLFLISLIAYTAFRFVDNSHGSYDLLDLSKELLGFGSFCLLLLLFKKSKIFQYALFIGALVVAYNYCNSTSIEKNSFAEVSEEYEILIELEDQNALSLIQPVLNKYDLLHETAFNIESNDNTSLDEFIKIDIPKANEPRRNEIFNALQSSPGVKWAEYNEVFRLNPTRKNSTVRARSLTSVNDPMTSRQWSLQAMKMDDYYQFFRTEKLLPKKQARLFILDTGIDSNHPDLKTVFKPHKSKVDQDNNGHGTMCAGIAGAHTNNGIGIASMAPDQSFVSVHAIKVISDFGFGTQIAIIDGIIEAVDHGADVISMSLGGRANRSREKAYEEVIAYAKSNGVIIVVAAGNSNTTSRAFVPANSDEVITVSAVDSSLSRAHFSNYISETTYGIAAPGTQIYSTYKQGQYAYFDGTSFAAPAVAGLVAVMRSLNPNLKTAEVYEILDANGVETSNTAETGRLIQPLESIKDVIKRES